VTEFGAGTGSAITTPVAASQMSAIAMPRITWLAAGRD
jgi:hypothetical protein